MVSMTIFFN